MLFRSTFIFDIGIFKGIGKKKRNNSKGRYHRNRRLAQSLVLDTLINKCNEEEVKINRKFKNVDQLAHATIESIGNFKKVTEKVDKLSYGTPNLIEYLYFTEKKEKSELEKDVKEDLLKFKTATVEKYLFGSKKSRRVKTQ